MPENGRWTRKRAIKIVPNSLQIMHNKWSSVVGTTRANGHSLLQVMLVSRWICGTIENEANLWTLITVRVVNRRAFESMDFADMFLSSTKFRKCEAS